MELKRIEIVFYFGLLLLGLVSFAYLLSPYLSTLILALSLSLIFYPLYQRVRKIMLSDGGAALAVVFFILLIVFIPLGLFGLHVLGEATALYQSLSQGGGIDPASTLTRVLASHTSNALIVFAVKNIDQMLQHILDWFIQNLGALFSGLAQGFSILILSLLGLFYLLKDGPRLRSRIISSIPLEPRYTREIMNEIGRVMSSVIKGTIVVAFLQGIAAVAGFIFFHIPDPTFWGSLVVLTSPIPLVGAWLIITPAVLYLFLTGQIFFALLLLIWSVVFVNLIYNIAAPILMNGGNIHPYLILLCILGGIAVFGPIGFLMGPLIAAFFGALLNIYPRLIDTHTSV